MPKKKNKKKKISEAERQRIIASLKQNSKSKSIEKKQPIVEINKEENKKNSIDENLKAPVIVCLGHVDAGKTSLQDSIRETSIAKKEAGGITQSINSSYVTLDYIIRNCGKIKGPYRVDGDQKKIPGFLLVDTPGHEAFNSLRERGSSLCDMAILVIDLIKGVKPQTIESIKLLKEKKIPFVIAATKLDKIYGWNQTKCLALKGALNNQDVNLQEDIYNYLYGYLGDIKYDLEKEGINAEYIHDNKKPKEVISIIPLSSLTKEGIADLLTFIVYLSQNWMGKKITYRKKVKATVMESKKDNKHGYVLDIILSNGTIKVGDKFAVVGKNGAKIVSVRNLMITTNRSNNLINSVRASQSVRIIGSDLDNVYAGTKLYPVLNTEKEAIDKANLELEQFYNKFNFSDTGIYLMAPTLGELEALVNIVKENKINIRNGCANLITEKEIINYSSMIEDQDDKETRIIMYFGKISDKEKENFDKKSSKMNIKFLQSEVSYQLIDQYKEYYKKCIDKKQELYSESGEAVFPCKIKILDEFIFMKGGNDDLMFGVKIIKGKLYKGTPIYCPDKDLVLGKVVDIQKDKKPLVFADAKNKEKNKVCIRISSNNYILYGRHFNSDNNLVSHVSRKSLDIIKKYFRDKMEKNDWLLLRDIKELCDVK
jgi:translation initiation factor 5B